MKCSNHRDEELVVLDSNYALDTISYYCISCNVPLCAKCIAEGNHNGHQKKWIPSSTNTSNTDDGSTLLLQSFHLHSNQPYLSLPTISQCSPLIDIISFWIYIDKPVSITSNSFPIISFNYNGADPNINNGGYGFYIDNLSRPSSRYHENHDHYYSLLKYKESMNGSKGQDYTIDMMPIQQRKWYFVSIHYNYNNEKNKGIESVESTICIDGNETSREIIYLNGKSNETTNFNPDIYPSILIGKDLETNDQKVPSIIISSLTIHRFSSTKKNNIISPTVMFSKHIKPIYPQETKNIEFQRENQKSKPLMSLIELIDWNEDRDSLKPISNVPMESIPGREIKIIYCHDFKGGYLEYESNEQLSNQFYSYNFNYWQLIDIFVYFSHNRITIPPMGWINNAHKNGVKILGTIIMEWEGGVPDACRLVDGIEIDEQSVEFKGQLFVDKLIRLTKHYKFDGWLINIESNLPNKSYGLKYKKFLLEFTEKIHKEIPGSLIIWYDSIIEDGKLKWQNELNQHNKLYFDSCDGIFLNYKWDHEKLLNSSKQLVNNNNRFNTTFKDVFVGTDVWGRGTFGGGNLNSYIGVKTSKEYKFSSALFAPSWTFELNNSSNRYYENKEAILWVGHNSVNNNLIQNGSGENNLENWIVTNKSKNDGWGISNDGMRKDGKSFIASFNWSKMEQCLDLIELGFGKENLDLSPIIQLEFYYSGTGPKFNDLLKYKIKLLDENKKMIFKYKSLEIVTENQFKCHFKEITDYPIGARYILLSFKGKDVEYWAGRFGPRITGIYLNVLCDNTKQRNNDSIFGANGSRVSSTKLPFKTNFNRGRGKSYSINGEVQSDNEWVYFSDQDITGCIEYGTKKGSPLIQYSHTFDYSFNGGASVLVNGKLNQFKKNNHVKQMVDQTDYDFSMATIFELDIPMTNGGGYEISFTTKKLDNPSNQCKLLLEFNNSCLVLFDNSSNEQETFIFEGITEIIPLRSVSQWKNGWTTFSFDFKNINGYNNLVGIRVLCINQNNNDIYKMLVGEIKIDKQTPQLSTNDESPNIQIEKIWNTKSLLIGKDVHDYLLYWNSTLPNNVSHDIYQKDKNNEEKFITRSHQNRYLLPYNHPNFDQSTEFKFK